MGNFRFIICSIFFGVLILFFIPSSFSQQSPEKLLQLRYTEPARIWEEALPLGNGRTGAMVFGGVREERFQLNDHMLWSGGPDRGNNANATELLPLLRQAIFRKDYKNAEEIWRKMQGPYSARYLPLGDLRLDFDIDGEVENYVRSLDLNDAISTVSFDVDGTRYEREAFVSYPAKALIVRLKANKKAKLNIRLRLDSKLQYITEASTKGLIMRGQTPYEVAARNYFPEQVVYNDKGVRFEAQVGVELKGGTLIPEDSLIRVRNADEVIIYLSESTNYSAFDRIPGALGEDAGDIARKQLAAVMKKGYTRAKAEHIVDYKKLFDRVSFQLAGGTDYSHMSTDQRLKYFSKHGDDFGLQELYYQFGRYLLISSSRPGSRPANLQGIWNDHIQPPWGSNYTININTEMNYWLAENTNLSECHEPLLSFIAELAVNGAHTAKTNYGIREGWVAHHNSDLWAKTSPVGHFDQDKSYYPQAFCWHMGGAWLSTHLWEHYQYSQDTVFLRKRAYPLMKGAAQFLVHWLVEDTETGYLVTAPSSSPENHFSYEGGRYSIGKGAAMDLAIVREQFLTVIKAAEVLNTDDEFRATLKERLTKIYPYQIGRYGQIQEWFDDVDDPKDTHRHISQLFGLFPGNEIDPLITPDLAKASKVTLEHRGDVSTGWSMAWKINWWARLRDGDRAYKILQKAFNYINPADKTVKNTGGGGTYPNLFDAHPPFQIDGNFGATAGITEMLLQSHTGVIDILPALPAAWKDGQIQGIKARGNFVVNLFWKDNKITQAELISVVGGKCTVRSNKQLKANKPVYYYENNSFWYIDIETSEGESIILN